MAMALHVAADHRAVEDVQGGKQSRSAVPPVIMRSRRRLILLHRQLGLGSLEGLDLRLLVQRQDDGMRGRIDIKTDDVAQLGHEGRIIGELELTDPMRLEPVRAPDPLHRTHADADLFGHHRRRPVGGFARRFTQRPLDDTLAHLRSQRRDTRRPRFVAQQAVDAFPGKAPLPAPDARLRFAGAAHDLAGACAVGAQQNDTGAPDMFLRGVAVVNDSLQAVPVRRRKCDRDPWSHGPRLARSRRRCESPMDSSVRFEPLEPEVIS